MGCPLMKTYSYVVVILYPPEASRWLSDNALKVTVDADMDNNNNNNNNNG